MSDRFMSVSEAAKELGVSARRIRQLIEDEELHARRIGNSWAIPAAEIYQRRRRSPQAGRPYDQENIWRLAALADVIANEYVNKLADDSSFMPYLVEQQDRAAEGLRNSIAEVCDFDVRHVIDNPSGLAELRRLLSRAQFLSRGEELLVGWIHQAVSHLHESGLAARVDSFSLAQEWLRSFGVNSVEADPNARLLRSLRNMLMHRLGRDERNIASLRSRFDQAEFYYAHPSFLVDLVSDGRLVLSGAHAAAHYGIDLIPGDSVDAYVGVQNAEAVLKDYSLEEADSLNGNTILRCMGELPDHHPPIAPRLCVGADLLEESDPRSQDAGARLLEALFAAVSFDQLSARWKYSSRG